MKVRVINLVDRVDRREQFEKTNSGLLDEWTWHDAVDGSKLNYEKIINLGFDTNKNWRDPLLKRTLTHGEIGCFLSHWQIWEECLDLDEPVLVLEDDAVLSEAPEDTWITGDITYLTHKEMLPGGVRGSLVCYPYWTAAYIITPKAARVLLESGIDKELIPVDEFLPRMTDKLKMTSLNKASQRSRSEVGTNVEPCNHKAYVKDFTVYNLTCFDDINKAEKLLATNPSVGNVLEGEWRGGDMKTPGGGHKLTALRKYIAELNNHDVVIFTDAYDVFWTQSPAEVVGRFLEMKAEVVFAAEKWLWPDSSLRFPPSATPYRYLNSGCFVGRVGEIKRILDSEIQDSDDDQLFLHKQFLSGRFSIALDYEQYIFQTNSEAVLIEESYLYNSDTKCFGCVYHGNGGSEAKARFEKLFHKHFIKHPYSKLEVKSFDVIGNEMLLVDFLTPSQCEEWIRIGDEHGGWNPHPADKFPSHDIHLKLLNLWDDCEVWWKKEAAKVFENYWKPTAHYHLRKAFLMKYSEDTQKKLGFHNDSAMITGSVKLNDDYEGATLVFPRQQVTNRDIPIGKMIIFPGQVTHGHYVENLQSGIKYSATFWTARYKNDLLDP